MSKQYGLAYARGRKEGVVLATSLIALATLYAKFIQKEWRRLNDRRKQNT